MNLRQYLELTNHGDSSLDFVISPLNTKHWLTEVGQWLSIGDGSGEGKTILGMVTKEIGLIC